MLLMALIAYGKSRNKNDLEVKIGAIEKRTIISSVAANGKIRPEGEVKISADVSGEIIQMNVNEGDTVAEGQLLLKINPDLYLTAVDRAQANLSSAQSAYKTNIALQTQSESRFTEQQTIFNRSSQLFDQGVISQAEFEAAQSAYNIAKSDLSAAKERVSAAQYGIENARAGLLEAQKNLQRTSIYAPSDGVVSALNSEQGERVVGTAQMAGTEIMIISNFNNMEVIVDVNENDILQISMDDTCLIEVDAYGDRIFKGVVTEIARSASGQNGIQISSDQVTNFEVKIRILKSSYSDLLSVTDAPFLPGMSASVEIQTEIARNILCLPIEAVTTRVKENSDTISQSAMEEQLDEVVFSFENGKAKQHIVKTGIQDSRYIQITEGLTDSLDVIIGPYDAVSKKLSDGRSVSQIAKIKYKEESE